MYKPFPPRIKLIPKKGEYVYEERAGRRLSKQKTPI
jgi:hypothetical protein